MANIIPVHKKRGKIFSEKTKSINYLLIFAKVFERLLFNSLFFLFHNNSLLTKCKSGFMPGDSYVSHLPSIVHESQSLFDYNPLTDHRGIFLDILKTFDKVWNEGLLFKLKSYGLEDNLFRLFKN